MRLLILLNLFVLSISLNLVIGEQTVLTQKSQNERLLQRQKRFLIFPGGGVAKFVGKLRNFSRFVTFSHASINSRIFGANSDRSVHKLQRYQELPVPV